MAIQGKAAKSASGASMSKYDVEVEGRLKALEAKAHDKCDGGGSGPSAEQWEELWGWYQAVKSRLWFSFLVLAKLGGGVKPKSRMDYNSTGRDPSMVSCFPVRASGALHPRSFLVLHKN